MLVSVVINNFNYARFLAECIESALAQTHRPVEVVVVDDGSTDDSRTVIERYRGRVEVVYKRNGGQGSALNAGFLASRGEAVCYVDADDILFSTAVEQAMLLLSDPCVPKVQWRVRVIDAEGRATGRVLPDRACIDGDLRAWVIENGPLYDLHFTPSGSATLYRRSFLEKVLPMPEPPYVNGADVYLTTLAPIFGTIRTAPGQLGSYRTHGANHFFGRPLEDRRLLNYLGRFDSNATALAEHLRRQGVEPDVDGWRRRNFNYVWPSRFLRAKRDIAALLPSGSRYVLIDDNEWAGSEPVADRQAIPFLEKDGAYWGAPADDATAVAEIERLRAGGATFVVVWWTAFWWLEHYPALARYLATRRRVVDEDHMLVLDLRSPAEHVTETEDGGVPIARSFRGLRGDAFMATAALPTGIPSA